MLKKRNNIDGGEEEKEEERERETESLRQGVDSIPYGPMREGWGGGGGVMEGDELLKQ